jgi:His-Xaa-Ser system protein HxsD
VRQMLRLEAQGMQDHDMNPNELTLEFDLRVCRLSAIKKAAHRFAGRYSSNIHLHGEESALVTLSLQSGTLIDAKSFQNEVLDQELREVVAEETKSIRQILLAHAFSQLSIVDPLGDTADFRDDPLFISVESHGAIPNVDEDGR